MTEHERNCSLSQEKRRLDQLDNDLRREADEFLRDSGLGRIVNEAGFVPVGSYSMRTMVWRDLDFERTLDEPTWRGNWELGQALADIDWVWRLSCIDAYRDPNFVNDFGLYLGVRASNPNGGPVWKLDLWTARPHEFAPGLARHAAWEALMTEEARLNVLAIKEAARSHPEYGKTLLSTHVYEAVLEHQVHEIEAFWDWWQAGCSEQC